jgi:hypothetical protein
MGTRLLKLPSRTEEPWSMGVREKRGERVVKEHKSKVKLVRAREASVAMPKED